MICLSMCFQERGAFSINPPAAVPQFSSGVLGNSVDSKKLNNVCTLLWVSLTDMK